MCRRRKSQLAAAGLAAGMLAAGAIAFWVAIPGCVRSEAVARIERRTGLRCAIGEFDIGLHHVQLRNVELRDEQGAIEARLGAISIDVAPWALALHGEPAIRGLLVRNGEIRVDVRRPQLAALAARVRDGASAVQPPPTDPRPRRTIRVEGLRILVRDAQGELVRIERLEARLESGEGFELQARDLALAGTTIERLDIRTGPEGRIAHLAANDVAVEMGERGADLRGAIARARAAVRQLLGRAAGAEAADAGGNPFAVIGEPFSGRVAQVTVVRRTADGATPLLSGLDFEIERVGPEDLQTRGHGRPEGGGRLRWELRIRPRALRAEGSVELVDVALAVVEPVLPDALPLHRSDETRLTGELRIEGQNDTLRATGRLAVRDLALASPRICAEPVRGITLALEGEATFLPASRRLDIARLRLASGAAHVELRGALEWAADHYLFDLEATLPPTRCNDAIAAIPRDLLGELAAFSMQGSIAGAFRVRVDSRNLDATTLTIRISDACRFEMVPALADLSRFERPFVHVVLEPDGTVFEMQTGPGTPNWTPISEISPFLLHAVLAHEDAGFFGHEGFSTHAIREALVRNLRAGRYVMGASTISMQLAKNAFLRREKTLARKVQEVLLTWWIERSWSKERILELYLNVIEYGPGVYGIRHAARHYFGVEPAALSPAQAAYLATILPNPRAYHAHWESGALPPRWASRLARFVRLLGERGRFDAVAVAEGLAEIPALRFHRDGDPTPSPRTFSGRTSPLPIAEADIEAGVDGDPAWDEVEPFDARSDEGSGDAGDAADAYE